MSMKPVNIVFFPHSVDYGLAGTNRLQNIIYFLKKEGSWSMSNIALNDKKRQDKNTLKQKTVLALKKDIVYGPSVFKFINHIFLTAIYLNKFKRQGKNVLYFYGEIDIKNFFFVTWARLLGYKVVIDIVEDLETITRFRSFKNKLKYKSGVFFRKHLTHFADGFTAVSTHLEKKIKSDYPSIPLFFLPVTVNKYLLNGGDTIRPRHQFIIFYSGSFNEKDGLPYLLAALQMLKQEGGDFKMVLSGGGGVAEMQKFWQAVEIYKVKEHIDYRGMLSRDNYINALCEADVLCMTRINSAFANAGFPFKLGEFLSTGKPVVASKVGDIEKYLTVDDALLVAPENAVEIKCALAKVIADKNLALAIGKNGKAVAMKYFDHELYSASLAEFMETTIWQ